ncbi:maltoporin [Photobacterium minamisatsumaniensis]|uniref:maltoporin n=1 Tax=Photobacterium minamisatsumaniensis TaxID=2910233 RepID=UPI003D112502
MSKKSLAALAISTALLTPSAFADDGFVFHGYARAGIGISGDNGQNVEFNKQQLGRLGNEADTFAEFGLGKEIYNEDGARFFFDSMLAVGSDGSNIFESLKDDEENGFIDFRQLNVQATGVLNFAPEATLWAGKRYYQRHDIHITDFYYWNTSGSGAGIENLNLGDGQFSFAVIRNDDNDVEDTGNRGEALNVNVIDMRYAGINLWSNADLELGINYAITNPSSDASAEAKESKDGVMATAQLTQNLNNGFNKTVVQYGTEGYAKELATFGAGTAYHATTEHGGSAYRLINWGVVSLTDKVDLGHQLLWSSTIDDIESDQKDDLTYLSAVIRPVYNWDKHHKTIVEAGYFSNQDISGQDLSGQKITIAQAWNAGEGFFARPEIRLYGTYFSNIDSIDENNVVSTVDSEFNVGVQVEAWW